MKRIIKNIIIGVIPGLIILIIQNFFTAWPFADIQIFGTHKIVDISDSDAALFNINGLRSYHGRLLNVGDRFSYKSFIPWFRHLDIPLSACGTTSYEQNVNIWCVCLDRHGNYYLQNPNVRIENANPKKWTMHAMYPRSEITFILFVLVDQVGNGIFRQRVINGDWGPITELPNHSKEIASIELR